MWILIIYVVFIILLIKMKSRKSIIYLQDIGEEIEVRIVTIDTILSVYDKTALSLVIFEDEFTAYQYAIIDDASLISKYELSVGDRMTAEISDNVQNPHTQAVKVFIENDCCTALQISTED